MGKGQKKTGKGRLDKYYKLAKEQGYRARSAFKLIQLNKKYSFLEGAKCCIDLCAAPGGWLQVASKYMPPNSLIVGVDLDAIRPIPRVATFVADITTPHCRNLLRGELKDWKADVVLHDGAPNVGTAWIQDAYTQSELVLMSLKLAVEFLIKGGTFVTKVFRSVDYNNLVWVFTQLFGKVEATKPPSSRNVSAEIFVVCRDFLAPKHIDPKFLDPRHVFKDLSASVAGAPEKGLSAGNAQANVFQPEKKRRHRDGYAEGDYTLHSKMGVSDFIKGADPIAVLGAVSQLTFDTEEEKGWLNLDVTTGDVKANCDDLKVLGRGDFKSLLKWRTALREEIGLDVKVKGTDELTEQVEVTEELDEDEQIQNELERLNSEAAARIKRERRKANESKQRTIQRMQLRMVAPLDIGLEQTDAQLGLGQEDVFDLDNVERGLRRRKDVINLAEGDMSGESSDEDAAAANRAEEDEDEILDSDEERERKVKGLEDELDGLYDSYRTQLAERDAKFRVKEARRKNALRSEEWGGVQKGGSGEEGSGEESEGEGGWDVVSQRRAAAGEEDSNSSEDEQDAAVVKKRRKLANGKAGLITSLNDEPKPSKSRAAQVWFSQDVFAGVPDIDDLEDDEEEEEESSEEGDDTQDTSLAEDDEAISEDDSGPDDDFEVVPQAPDDDVEMWDVDDEDEDAIKQRKIMDHGLLTAEAVALAQRLVNRETTRTHLINEGFNRYSLNSKDDLPTWFLDDESHHYRPNIPITKEAVAALRAKQRALDARPIKKIAEAKARKKFKAAQRLEKALKKAQGVNESADMTEREKAQQIQKVMRRGESGGKKRKETKVVVAKGVHKGIKGRPKGVKGRYAMVDARMRKEVRAKKRSEKANKKRKRN